MPKLVDGAGLPEHSPGVRLVQEAHEPPRNAADGGQAGPGYLEPYPRAEGQGDRSQGNTREYGGESGRRYSVARGCCLMG